MKCPKCKFVQPDTNAGCASCGFIISRMGGDALTDPAARASRAGWLKALLPAALFAGLVVFVGSKVSLRDAIQNRPGSGPAASRRPALLDQLCRQSAAEHGAGEEDIEAACNPAYARRPPAAAPSRPKSPPAPLRELNPAARDAYESAKRAVWMNDMVQAFVEFGRATQLEPDFTEAWYNLGAAYGHSAIASVRDGDNRAAVNFFRQAVAAKRRAQGLIDRDIWFVYYTEQERSQVLADLQGALKDAAEVMENEESLIAALRLWARTHRY